MKMAEVFPRDFEVILKLLVHDVVQADPKKQTFVEFVGSYLASSTVEHVLVSCP